MKKSFMFWLKLLVMLAVLGFVGKKVYSAWHDLQANPLHQRIAVDWRYAPIAIAGFAGVMLTSGIVWRWVAYRMGNRGHSVGLMGAYTFSQMGKYIPGKVVLLWMRIDRAAPLGMDAGTCTLSTLLENALYMISGGIAGTLAIAKIADQLKTDHPAAAAILLPATIACLLVLGAACHPAIFYDLVARLLPTMNRLLGRLNRPPVQIGQHLRMPTLALGVLLFFPCWAFGGLALWASTCCVHVVPISGCVWFMGAFALSVIIGMASFLPAGLGIREAVLGAAVTLQLSTVTTDHSLAVAMAAVAVVLQRLFQILVEVGLGAIGAAVTSGTKTLPAPVPHTI